jgi:hypothetical protein
VGIAEGNEDDPVVGQGRHGGNEGTFLATTGTRCGDEHAGVLAGEGSPSPELACGVPERLQESFRQVGLRKIRRCANLPLSREVAVSSRDAKHKSVVSGEDIRSDDRNIGRLGRCVHLRQDLLGQGFSNSDRTTPSVGNAA